jgi:hypothetical protein
MGSTVRLADDDVGLLIQLKEFSGVLKIYVLVGAVVRPSCRRPGMKQHPACSETGSDQKS